MIPAGIYIHWPFCARKCPYCDFYTFGREHPLFDLSGAYLDALRSEIDAAGSRFAHDEPPLADTIYFGGGTPSLIEPQALASILDSTRARFRIADDAEITLEVNPTAAEGARLGPARELGVNRLSVGVQSFDDRFLTLLGRDHDAATARRVLAMTREFDYDNVSLDLMFGLPGQTLEDLTRDLEAALAFGPEHVSAYGLTYHAGTPFARWRDEGRLTAADPELEADMFELLIDRLAGAGYEHYEISNWARAGRASRHNSKYWRRCDVYAFGPSAHGVVGGRRYANPRDLKAALARARGGAWPGVEYEPPLAGPRAAAAEVMMLAIRRVQGVAWEELREWIGEDAREVYRAELARLTEDGLMELNDEGMRPTRRGVLMANTVAGRFF